MARGAQILETVFRNNLKIEFLTKILIKSNVNFNFSIALELRVKPYDRSSVEKQKYFYENFGEISFRKSDLKNCLIKKTKIFDLK